MDATHSAGPSPEAWPWLQPAARAAEYGSLLVTIAALGDLEAARLNLSCHSRMRKTLMPIKAARVTCYRISRFRGLQDRLTARPFAVA